MGEVRNEGSCHRWQSLPWLLCNRHFLRCGTRVHSAPSFSEGVEIVATDYSAPGCHKLVADCDAILHLAARRVMPIDDPVSLPPFVSPNIELLAIILRAALKLSVSRFVLASSISVYSLANKHPYRESDIPRPTTPKDSRNCFTNTIRLLNYGAVASQQDA